MDFSEFQEIIKKIYYKRDSEREITKNFLWLIEELGELSEAMRHEDREMIISEFADVIAWTSSIANLLNIDLNEAAKKYLNGCPKCRKTPCGCD